MRQKSERHQGAAERTIKFTTPWLYKIVRHPLYVGWFLVFWATPTMTAAHLLFAVVTTIYILIATRLEERDLEDSLGEAYTDYKQRVPRFVPGVGKTKPNPKLQTA
jgi:protein-S-isoprenylcysteine O-methyltransferase Ste14